MKCFKCGSMRIVKFIDGFGQRRLFCKGCWGSFLDSASLGGQSSLNDFNLDAYYNRRAIIRHF